MCFAPQRRALFRHLHLQKWSEHGVLSTFWLGNVLFQHLNFQEWSDTEVFCTFWLRNVLRATTACTFQHRNFQKVVRHWGVLYMLTSKYASRHMGVHFFNGPNLVYFVHFDFEMCFAPQRRALFRHRNFQKWSDAEVFYTFWLRNMLRATRACTFSTSQLPKVVRHWGALCVLTSKCASRYNGVCFFDISTSKSGPSMVCFVHFDLEMCFAPQRRAIFHLSSGQLAPHPPLERAYFSTIRSLKSSEKHSVSRLSDLFAHLHLLSSDSFSSLIFSLLIFLFSLPLPCSAFHLSILSEVWLLNFLRLYYIYYILYLIYYILYIIYNI